VVRDALVLVTSAYPAAYCVWLPAKQNREPVLEGYETNFAMSIELRREDEIISNTSTWISQSEAARLRGVSREAIYYLVKKNRLKILKTGHKTLVNRLEVENYRPRLPGPKPKTKKRNEAESTPPPDRRQSTTPQGRTRNQSPAQQNKYLINKRGNDQDLQKYISQAEAARIRGVSYQAITDLIKRGRLTTAIVAGRPVVLRSEVENFVAQPKLGRPAKKTISKKSTKGK
jgi:excisionase family DNA binding protein